MTITHSDVINPNRIEQEGQNGELLVNGDKVYIATASGEYRDGKPILAGCLQRYTRVKINGWIVLLTDDAVKSYREGVLIKVGDSPDRFAKLAKNNRESFEVLGLEPKKDSKAPAAPVPKR